MKSLASALLFLLALASPLLAFMGEQIRVEPDRPTSTERIRVTVRGVWPTSCTPRFEKFEAADGVALVHFAAQSSGACLPVLTLWSDTAMVGPLSAGTWEVRARTGEDTDVSTTITVVAAPYPFELIPSSSRIEGGGTIVVRGPNLARCSVASCRPLRVLFDGAEVIARPPLPGDSAIELVAPPHAAGRVDVTVETPEGANITREDAFLYYDAAEGPPREAFELILVPVMFEGDGAFGSRWTTELAVHNRTDAPIDPWNTFLRCGPEERCSPQLPAGSTLHLTPGIVGTWMHGYLVAVPREQAGGLDFSLHVRDLSRQAESFGTEVPVVREKELPASPIVLLDVPLGDDFRRMLRIYDLSAIDGSRVAIRWRLDNGTYPVRDAQVELRTVARCATITTPCWFPEPSGIAMPLFEYPLPPFMTQDHLHVEIEPLTPGSRIWAFVTVTNNDTQQVTTITPQ